MKTESKSMLSCSSRKKIRRIHFKSKANDSRRMDRALRKNEENGNRLAQLNKY